MCCPLTQATATWYYTMFIMILLGIGSPMEASGGTSVHSSSYLSLHNNHSYHSQFPPFVASPIPNQNITTDSDPIVIPLYNVFSSDDNSRLSFRVVVTNESVADAEIQNDTLYVFPKSTGSTRVRVIAEDDDDDEATDTFRLNIRENNPPSVIQDFPIRDQVIVQGNTYAVDLASIFEDPDGDPLSYEVTSSDTEVSTPTLEDGVLIAPADSPGLTTIEITAIDPFMRTIAVEFELEVLRPYPQFIEAGFSISFGAINNSSSYKLVALPGDLSLRIEETAPGVANRDWTAYIQDSTANSLVLYSMTDDFEFQPGNGIWFLSKRDWVMRPQNVPSVPLSRNGTYTIPLRAGWNIISNPFDLDLDWEEVLKWNGYSQALWSWDGNYEETNEFQSASRDGRAYYYFNAEQASSLQLPYPGLAGIVQSKTARNGDIETLAITVKTERAFESKVTVGRSDQALPGIDGLDYFAPPHHFSEIAFSLTNKNLSFNGLPLARDVQPRHQELLRFDLMLHAEKGDLLSVRIDNLDLFESDAVTLVNLLDASTYNLHEKADFWFTPEKEETPFALFLGPADTVQEAIDQLHPLSLLLKQNYPNPVQSSTTFEFSLPDPQHATLSIYDAMGRLIKVLLDRELDAGLHHVEWHRDDQQLANGIYLYRLKTDSNTLHRKMILLR